MVSLKFEYFDFRKINKIHLFINDRLVLLLLQKSEISEVSESNTELMYWAVI